MIHPGLFKFTTTLFTYPFLFHRILSVAYLLVAYPTPEKISGSWQRMQQEAGFDPQ